MEIRSKLWWRIEQHEDGDWDWNGKHCHKRKGSISAIEEWIYLFKDSNIKNKWGYEKESYREREKNKEREKYIEREKYKEREKI